MGMYWLHIEPSRLSLSSVRPLRSSGLCSAGATLVLVMIGALLPDIFKLYLPLRLFWANAGDALALFHIPIGTLLVCGLCALLFGGDTGACVPPVHLGDAHAL
jgi:hypothetical protein